MCFLYNFKYYKQIGYRAIIKSENSIEGFEVTLDPGPVQEDVYEHQDGENEGQIEMDAAPFVTIHRPEIQNLYRSPAAAKTLAVPC